MAVNLDITDGIAQITMDDGKAYAMGVAMFEALGEALDKAEADARAVVLAGRPGVFCAGFDLKVMAGGDSAAIADLLGRGGRLLHRLYGMPVPLVAAATGHGLALGALVLLACDTRVGPVGEAKFGLNETAIGMVLPTWGLALAMDRVVAARQTEAILQANIYDPAGAVTAGFLDDLVAPEAVLDTAVARAAALAELPGHAYAGNKAQLRAGVLEVIAAAAAEHVRG